MKKNFEEKYKKITDILEKNYKFKKVLEKKIWSLELLAICKQWICYLKNKWRGGRVVEGAR